MKLSDHAHDLYSQFGEDGMVDYAFRAMGEGGQRCVEFGAADGLSCSNTARLWRNRGWQAALIEADPTLHESCRRNAENHPETVRVINATVSVTNPDHSIDAILAANGFDGNPDLMSVDIDGDDFYVVTNMKLRPRLLLVEFNPTVPPHIDLKPAGPGQRFGVGITTLKQAMEWRGWSFIGCSYANAFFVNADDAHHFADLETDPAVLMPAERFTYLASDYDGQMVPVGEPPPWGLRWPPSHARFAANQQALLDVDCVGAEDRWQRQITDRLRAIEEKLG